jgi:LacI family transcriptional regulator
VKPDKNSGKALNNTEDEAAKPVGLKVLAEHLGLSITAVSRVLNGTPAAKSIPPRTQQRILEAARQFNYRPNIFARSLRNRRSSTIGVMVPEVSEGYATAVLSGIEQQLLEEDYFYLVVSHHHRNELIEKYQQLLMARSIEGLIAVDTLLPEKLQVSTVTVSGHHEPEGITNIVLNHGKAAILALEHLKKLGHKRIAFIKGQRFSSDTAARWNAIQSAASRLSLPISPALITQLEGDLPTHEPGYIATQKLLATGHRFTALFSFNDISAIGAIRALREAGLGVPEDVSVVGFDDVQSAAYQNPALTTVRQPLQKMGGLAAKTVLQMIKDNNETAAKGQRPGRLIVDPELVVRDSTARPALARTIRSSAKAN